MEAEGEAFGEREKLWKSVDSTIGTTSKSADRWVSTLWSRDMV